MNEGVMTNAQRLVYMVNQIARNLGGQSEQAAAATADHLIQFWNPRMKTQIIAMAGDPSSGLSETASRAVAILAAHPGAGVKPGLPVRSAIEPLGGSDAG